MNASPNKTLIQNASTLDTDSKPLMSSMVLAFPTRKPVRPGKAGKGGDLDISNADFIAAVFPELPENAYVGVCSKSGDPNKGVWPAKSADQGMRLLTADKNNYLNCSIFRIGDDGSFKARRDRFAGCHFFLLDDLETKISPERLGAFKLSWKIETSPGNYQGGIILSKPIADGAEATALLKAIINAELCDKGASGPLSRWARLPVAINGKSKYQDEKGNPFHCRLVEWNPDLRYSPEEIITGLSLDISPPKLVKPPAALSGHLRLVARGDDVFTPKLAENPIITALRARELYKSSLGEGKHDMTCPWAHEHTDELDTGAAYFEPNDSFPLGGFCCQHSHRDKYHIRELLEYLEIPTGVARHKPVIRVIAGEMHRVVDAGEKVLADQGHHYQSGGLIVSISIDKITGDPTIVGTNSAGLTKELSAAAIWEKYDGRSKDWIRCDPVDKHVSIIFQQQSFKNLPSLAGLARQPYFRESDGVLIKEPGYDKASQRFGVFEPSEFVIPEMPTLTDAQDALRLLEELLGEFHFVAPNDKTAALSAIFTAVVRSSIPYAPAFHIKAPIYGSGKTFLCELIGAFAGPGQNTKVSYPTTSEEATKSMLSLLLTCPAVIEFDDMATDWIPHGSILRMLTSERVTDRILGVSKVGTVSTRTLFLGSGNNTGAVRDLLRRVLTINIDPKCATPAMIGYSFNPLEQVRKDRGCYVAAVLTIILAWRQAGKPHTHVDNIATYGGAWSENCRQPLLWLGQPDPATALFEQVKQNPDGDSLHGLMVEWQSHFGTTATTVRKAIVESDSLGGNDLLDAMRECPVEEKGEINPSKLGWYIKKNANRIVDGLMFQQSMADGRTAWRVVLSKPPGLPPLTPLLAPPTEIASRKEGDVAVD
jgi:hypothetical protein